MYVIAVSFGQLDRGGHRAPEGLGALPGAGAARGPQGRLGDAQEGHAAGGGAGGLGGDARGAFHVRLGAFHDEAPLFGAHLRARAAETAGAAEREGTGGGQEHRLPAQHLALKAS